MRARARVGIGLTAAAVVALSVAGEGQPQRSASATSPPAHAPHRTPEGWSFSWPKGDPTRGREVFARFECWRCHDVKGEAFPAPSDKDAVGPELSQMGPLHEPAFFAEAVINPNAVLDPAYAAPDGSSRMPSFNDSMTIQEAIDLVAYLAALRPPPAGRPRGGSGAGRAPRDTGGHQH